MSVFFRCFPNAAASAIPFGETQNQDVHFGLLGYKSYTWNFDFTSEIGPLDVVDWAKLSIDIDDPGFDGWPFYAREYANLKLDGTTVWDSYEVDNQVYTWGVGAKLDDGMLSVYMQRDKGNFKVDWVKVEGEYTKAVPEPATMLLLGLGIFGIAGARRKFLK